ncbi:ABC transporter ATP-binding protein [Acetobacterium sp.]|jgi:nickel transport system ATP-binding protein|uniref:ABC transporter ATP-binding protein n=1 Tax=Acetobacterium sp. TaxID=1872094 RepID=UPI002723D015|nr:dipeptide/oligopeptide/nickel ABC transporter ATP-binding protein [Acetobacterium sp.]MDO9491533.1 dipeptide/oligopeptide/nickel ABC transporter ATP-binding protein [Acetobacterium sp.]
MNKGECLGIIGESGSGKSTLGRLVLGIEKPDSGEILYMGKNVNNPNTRLGHMSTVFQDYSSSINPNACVFEAIAEPMMVIDRKYNHKRYEEKIIQLLEDVGLNRSYLKKYPHELSGGEAQRVCIARAISTEPQFLLLDEAISSLDVSIQTQILNLFLKLKEKYKMSYLFITHDIQAAVYICDRIIFFNDGKIIEETAVNNIGRVKDPYSRSLLAAVIPF